MKVSYQSKISVKFIIIFFLCRQSCKTSMSEEFQKWSKRRIMKKEKNYEATHLPILSLQNRVKIGFGGIMVSVH